MRISHQLTVQQQLCVRVRVRVRVRVCGGGGTACGFRGVGRATVYLASAYATKCVVLTHTTAVRVLM